MSDAELTKEVARLKEIERQKALEKAARQEARRQE
jgi:hypothetical protein